eukprot:gene20716-biopygen14645
MEKRLRTRPGRVRFFKSHRAGRARVRFSHSARPSSRGQPRYLPRARSAALQAPHVSRWGWLRRRGAVLQQPLTAVHSRCRCRTAVQ